MTSGLFFAFRQLVSANENADSGHADPANVRGGLQWHTEDTTGKQGSRIECSHCHRRGAHLGKCSRRNHSGQSRHASAICAKAIDTNQWTFWCCGAGSSRTIRGRLNRILIGGSANQYLIRIHAAFRNWASLVRANNWRPMEFLAPLKLAMTSLPVKPRMNMSYPG